MFSELGLIARVRHELDIYLPWAAGFVHASVDYQEEIKSTFIERFAPTANLLGGLRGASFASMGSPVNGHFSYPSDKRPTKDNIERMRRAEEHLDMFWKKVGDDFKRKVGKTLDQTVGSFFNDPHPIERTPVWVEPTHKT